MSFFPAGVRKINNSENLKREALAMTCQASVNVVCIHFDLKQIICLKTKEAENKILWEQRATSFVPSYVSLLPSP